MSTITIFLVTPSTRTERLVSPHSTLSTLRGKIEQLTGLPSSSQRLSLAGRALAFADDDRTLDDLGFQEGDTLHIDSVDTAALARLAALDDEAALAGVEKFELTTEEYAARRDTVRSYKERNRIGRFAEPTPPPPPTPMATDIDPSLVVDARCELREEARRGRIAFVGESAFASGPWVGVELDEPKAGKGDGEVAGKRYFACRRGHAVFVRPDAVRAGDFPELDLMDDDEEL